MKESAGFITIVTDMIPMNVMSGRINVYLDLNILTWMIAAPLNLKKINQIHLNKIHIHLNSPFQNRIMNSTFSFI